MTPQELERERLLTPPEVATWLGFSGNRDPSASVRYLVRTGELPCIRFGSVYRFSRGAVEAYIEKHRQGAGGSALITKKFKRMPTPARSSTP